MNGPNREGFLKAMDDEIFLLTGDLKAWNVVDRDVAIKKNKQIFDLTWAFKI